MRRHRTPLNGCTFLPLNLRYFRRFHYALKSKDLKPQTHQQHWLLQHAARVHLHVHAALRSLQAAVAQPGGPPAPACCVCGELCPAGSQAVCVVLKGDALCRCCVTKDGRSSLNINAHVLKVLGLPAR